MRSPPFLPQFAVFLVAGIYCYAYYVFVVRVSVKMVRMEEDRLGNRTQGSESQSREMEASREWS